MSLTRAAWQTQWPAIVGAGLLGALALTHVHDGRAASSLLSGVAEWCAVGLIGAAAVTGRVLVARARRRDVMAAARWQVVVGLVADEAADAPIPIFRGNISPSAWTIPNLECKSMGRERCGGLFPSPRFPGNT